MKPSHRALRRERIIKLAAVLGLLSIGLVVILTVENMLLSFILAFVISYLLGPLVTRLERAGISRNLAILIPFCLTGVLLIVGINLLVPLISSQMSHLKAEIPKYIDGTTKLFADTEAHINLLFNSLYKIDISTTVKSRLVGWTASMFQDLPFLFTKMLTISLLAPLFAYFMLKDGRGLIRSLLSMVPNNLFELALNLQHQINEQMGGFVRARLLEAALVGAVVWAGLALISFPYASLLGLFAALTNLIPYIGPFIGAIPTFIIAFINGGSGLELALVGLVYLVSQLIDILFVIPLVVAKIVNLHPVTVIITIIIGSEVMGVLGMVISIPITSVLKLTSVTIYNHLVEFRSP